MWVVLKLFFALMISFPSQPPMSALNGPPGGHPAGPIGPMVPGAPRPTFPAYRNQPLLNNAPSVPEVPRRPVAKVTPVGPACKLIHPEDDLSLVSVFEATEQKGYSHFDCE